MAAKLIALFTKPDDPAAFDQHYYETHLPLAKKMPGLARIEVSKIAGNVMGGEVPYYLITEMFFDDMDAVKAALKSPEGQAAGADVMAFAGKYLTLLTSEVQVVEGAGVS